MTYGARRNAFIWTADSGYSALPTGAENPYGAFDGAYEINDCGVIVGSANFGRTGTYVYRAAVWEPVTEPTAFLGFVAGLPMILVSWHATRKRRA